MRYKVGDKVRVRPWKSMEEEFGTRQNGNITCRGTFVPSMRRYCGQVLTVVELLEGEKLYSMLKNDYSWSDDMLEDLEFNSLKYKDGEYQGLTPMKEQEMKQLLGKVNLVLDDGVVRFKNSLAAIYKDSAMPGVTEIELSDLGICLEEPKPELTLVNFGKFLARFGNGSRPYPMSSLTTDKGKVFYTYLTAIDLSKNKNHIYRCERGTAMECEIIDERWTKENLEN